MTQGAARLIWRGGSLAAIVVLLLVALAFSATPTTTQAQGLLQPTATPNDPVWRGYSALRDAFRRERNVDLTIVQRYDWEQQEYLNGIDDCRDLDDPNAGRQVYWGWTYTITDLFGNRYQGRVSFDLSIVVLCDRIIESGAAAVAADPDPNLPPGVAGSAAVGGFELGGHVVQLNANTTGLMRRSGMTWVKKQVRHTRGANAFDNTEFINAARSNGFKVLLGVVGDPNGLATDFDGYVADYAGYVGGLASMGADAIEVWNEPNIQNEWPPSLISGANYTRLLAAAAQRIRGASATTLIISAAPAPTGFFGTAGCGDTGCNDDTFMQQMAAAGAAQYVDCIGLHYNEGIIPPNQGSGDPRGGYPTYYFGSMLNRGYAPFGGKPVCFTELGYLSGQGFQQAIPASFAWANNTTVQQQAAWLAEAATLSAQSGRVRLMIVWNVDFPSFTATDPQGGYAMFRPDGTCPACDTLGRAMGAAR